MADVFSAKRRSEIMSRVKGRRNAATELRLIAIFRKHDIRGWRRGRSIFGRPDFVFPAARLAVFVDGCFWHGCPLHGTEPQTNRGFWVRKIKRNKERDRLVGRNLRMQKWRILRVWQHDLQDPYRVARRVLRSIDVGSGNGRRQQG
ncbi:MAG: very short patch repair endonuclease [Limisphaerales bacterium]